MYALDSFGRMIRDSIRMHAYHEALRRTVTPGSIVVDIGTGTGIHALIAARLGARRVYAVEPAQSVVLAPRIAKENGLDKQITFIQDLSTRIDLPERADVIVSDLHGVLPWYKSHIETIADARDRHLKPGGQLIPQRDTVWVGAVEAPDLYREHTDPWRQQPFGFSMEAAAEITVNSISRGRVTREAFLTEPVTFASLDYNCIADPHLLANVTLRPSRPGTLHGFSLWFDTVLIDGVSITSAPYEPPISYGSAFLPVRQPVRVEPEDTIHFDIQARYMASDYTWLWQTRVVDSNDDVKAQYRQSSMQGKIYSMQQLMKRTPDSVPTLGRDGLITRFVLNMADGENSVAEIATRLYREFQGTIKSKEEALERVRSAVDTYA